MLYIVSWFFVLTLLAIWSACIWIAHSLASWSLSGIGSVVGQTQQMDRLPIPDWIAAWIPPDLVLALKATSAGVLPWVESALNALPSVGSWLSPLAWTVWGVGFVILAVGAALLHALVSVSRRAAA
jgi:hypothetical protein